MVFSPSEFSAVFSGQPETPPSARFYATSLPRNPHVRTDPALRWPVPKRPRAAPHHSSRTRSKASP